MSTQSILVNGTEILIINEGLQKFVAIKPICQALGVNYPTQLDKLKDDENLGSTISLRGTVGADEKLRDMQTIPLRYVFGWLFTINPKNVNPDIKVEMVRYRQICYDALFDLFTKRTSILKEKLEYQTEIESLEKELEADDRFKKIKELKQSVKNASQRLNTLDKNAVNEQLDLFKNNNTGI